MRLSKYNIIFSNKVYNTKTKALVELDDYNLKLIKNKSIDKLNKNDIVELTKIGIIAKDDGELDEILEEEKRYCKEHLNITFFPTTACNFRCKYCYEDHIKKELTKTEYNSIIEFIKINKDLKYVNIGWFGGEPLIKINEIVKFMSELKKELSMRNIILTSNMTTNFYLANLEVFKKLLDVGVTNFQVTIDGLEASHNFYRPLSNGNGTFSTIIKNLLAAKTVSKNFNITIRLNYDNKSDYTEFFEYIKKEFSDKRYSFMLVPISEWSNEKFDFVCNESIEQRQDELVTLAKKYNLLTFDENWLLAPFIPCYACMENSFCVYPNNKILKCTVHLDDDINTVGSIEQSIVINDDKWNETRFNECKNCKLYPVCLGKDCKYNGYPSYIECEKANVDKFIKGAKLLWN